MAHDPAAVRSRQAVTLVPQLNRLRIRRSTPRFPRVFLACTRANLSLPGSRVSAIRLTGFVVSRSELFTSLRCPAEARNFYDMWELLRGSCLQLSLLPVLRQALVATCTCISYALVHKCLYGWRAGYGTELNDISRFEIMTTAVNFDITETRADQHAARHFRQYNNIQRALLPFTSPSCNWEGLRSL